MVPQAASVYGRALVRVADRVHLQQRASSRPYRRSHTGTRLGWSRARPSARRRGTPPRSSFELLTHERVSQARVVATSSYASDDVVRLLVEHLHLLHGLLADDGLVEEDVVEDAAQRVFCTVMRDAVLDGLAYRDPKASGVVGVLGEELLSDLREVLGEA